MFWKKHRPRCFWRCSKKAETSCSRCILAMFLLTILNELKNCSKFFEICDKLWQQCVYSNNLLTKILAWKAILYQRGINIVGTNHFWRCGPRPKTSRKTSHFLLNDAMFQRCFEKNIDLDVFDDVWKNPKHHAHDASNDVNRPPLPPVTDEICERRLKNTHLERSWVLPTLSSKVPPTLSSIFSEKKGDVDISSTLAVARAEVADLRGVIWLVLCAASSVTIHFSHPPLY